MDKKTIIGLVLIGVIFFGFTWYNNTKQAEYQKQKAAADSIAAVKAFESLVASDPLPAQGDTVSSADSSGAQASIEQHLGKELYEASSGTEDMFVVENELAKFTFSNKGGKIAAVELKDYKTYDQKPLMLFTPENTKFDISFFIKKGYNNAQINTSDFYFTPIVEEGETFKNVIMRLNVDSASYVDFVYSIENDNYMIGFDVRFVNMESILASNQGDMEIEWSNVAPQTEKGFSNEKNYTTLAYNYPGEKGIETLGRSDSKQEKINTKIKWVGFKNQFFSSIFVADDNFQNGEVICNTLSPNSGNIKEFYAKLGAPMSSSTNDYSFNFYFGPNKFSTLKKYDLQFERLIPLGGWIVGWINRLVVIPVFDILGKYIASYGLIILILTILIKILIAPLTYKSYLSSAKMRLLKPEMDQLNEKYPKQEDAMKKQQAVMDLYKSAGVNPLGGCLPLLIQFPILIAMFQFFPASIELRGEKFLWADDLSSYDSILNLPFDIPFYGNHVSLFALLMAVSVYISSKINYNQTAQAGPQMAGMKFMMLYMMPVMLLFWFNNYSSGLSYYYLVSNIFTIGQTYAFRYGVSDEKLHARMKQQAKKPKKKSKWQERYSELLKQQQQQQAAARKKK